VSSPPGVENPGLSVAIVGAYPPDPSVIGNGVEAVVLNLIEGLRVAPGIRVEVVSSATSIRDEKVVYRDGVPVHFIPSTRRLRNLTFDAMNKGRVRRKVAALKPDILHVHNHALFPYIGLHAPLQPTVTTVHGIVFEEVKYQREARDWLRKPLRRQLERMTLGRCREVIAVSDYVASAIRPLTPGRITVIENPVAERYFSIGAARSSEDRVAGAGPTVLFAGGLMRLKNVLDLIRAVELVRTSIPGIELRVAGAVRDPEYFKAAQQYVATRGLGDCVHFLGQLSEPELGREYERCGVVASASHEETAGMVFQQAMAAGIPVVATKVGGIPFIVKDGETGLLVTPGDVQQLAAALGDVLNGPGRRASLGAAGRHEALRRFTPAGVAARTIELYREMAQRHGAAH